MTEQYFCSECKEFTPPDLGQFQHPHLGIRSCLICPKCHRMVYLKGKNEKGKIPA